MWEALYVKALSRSLMLQSTKARFAKITVEEIDEFLKIIGDSVIRFEEEGPGSVGQELDSGLMLMDVRQSFNFREYVMLGLCM
jgi:dynein heavy chain